MKRVTIVQSFDGHPIGAKVELSESAADSAVIQRRGVVMPEDNPTFEKPTTDYRAQTKAVLIEMLEMRNIEVPQRTTKADLIALLEADDD